MPESSIVKTWNSHRHSIMSVGVVLFMVCTIIWNLPTNWEIRKILSASIAPVMSLLGLEQNFNTFGPNVSRNNSHLFADVIYSDKSTQLWSYPEIEHLPSILDQMQESFYRRFYTHSLADRKFLYKCLARYIASESDVYQDKKPVYVRIFRIVQPIPRMDPNTGEIAPQPNQYRENVLEKRFDTTNDGIQK